MTETTIQQALHEAVVEVLEKMFFIEAGAESASDPAPATPAVTVELAFDGEHPGTFRMSLARAAAALIAADFLGEDAPFLSLHQVDEVAMELANMICGAVLSRVESSATFRLAAPGVIADESTGRIAVHGTVCEFETGSGILTAAIDMETTACSPTAKFAS